MILYDILIKGIYNVDGIEEIYIITNGINIKKYVKDFSLYGVNISKCSIIKNKELITLK